ncbi:portal protein [Xanthobacteraceae bacterium Astr-EGSB]|uniref:portal protein n=1 Tax=Astrobacterium formosum TaxID=3069710 RepID=UPI0027B35830|nr:portal protein [Xanthobacteraceae bacterium Astr-EGSB]
MAKKPTHILKPPPADEPVRPSASKELPDDFHKLAAERADEAYQADRHNIEAAYEDLTFLGGDQWPDYAKVQREAEDRPMLTENRLPQFVQQVTGDIDLNKPSTKIVPIDGRATEDVANILKGMIRYVKNRSEAEAAFGIGADQQVACGMGHMRVGIEYADETTFNSECRVMQIDDGVSVLWDPNSKLPTREDAEYCFVPVDMSHAAFKRKHPDAPFGDFNSYDSRYSSFWYGSDFVRVAEYWEKRPVKRTLALHADGAVEDLTDRPDTEIAEARAAGAEIRKRDGFKVFRSLITLGHTLEEPEEWPGRMIPIVPLIGKEIRIGRKTIRYGIVRFAKDPQRRFNFFTSAEAEVLGLAPKAPWIGTKKNFQDAEDKWGSANTVNHPYLEYTPDPLNGGQAPQRVAPPIGSSGLSDAVDRADLGMKATTGIYDASLGSRSNETSGVAIQAREAQGDTGNIRYIKNFMLGERQIDRILLDLIPRVYDTERMVQVLDDDGSLSTITINQAVATGELDADPDEPIEVGDEPVDEGDEFMGSPTERRADAEGVKRYINDVTIGSYGVVVENGPSYSTRRDEAKAGMEALMKAVPNVVPLILDLYVKAQDWPLAQDMVERIRATLPPAIQAIIAREKAKAEGKQAPDMPAPGAQPAQPAAPQGPPPEVVQAEMAKLGAEVAKAQAGAQTAEANARKAEIDLRIRELELQAELRAGTGVDHTANSIAALVEEVARIHGMVNGLVEMMAGEPAETVEPAEHELEPGSAELATGEPQDAVAEA